MFRTILTILQPGRKARQSPYQNRNKVWLK